MVSATGSHTEPIPFKPRRDEVHRDSHPPYGPLPAHSALDQNPSRYFGLGARYAEVLPVFRDPAIRSWDFLASRHALGGCCSSVVGSDDGEHKTRHQWMGRKQIW